MRSARRHILATATGVLLVLSGVVAPATAAEYRYWSYWTITDGRWVFAPVGPASRTPADGDVDGWRFGISGVTSTTPPAIEAGLAFDSVCGDTPVVDASQKRVALIIDAGNADDAPDGETPPPLAGTCVVTESRASSFDVLQSATGIRTKNGFVCGIAGYPADGCGEAVANKPKPKPIPTPSQTKTSPNPTASANSPSATPKPKATKTPKPEPTPTTSSAGAVTPREVESATPTVAPIAASSTTSSSTPWLPAAVVIALIVIAGFGFWLRRR